MRRQWQTDISDHYYGMSDDRLSDAIEVRRAQLGKSLLILGHHYQQETVIRHADLTGDSLKLSRLAAEAAGQQHVKYIIFCGVNFMAETADLLTDPDVAVILPHMSAACPMAAMADVTDVAEAWESIHASLAGNGRHRVVPVAYVNSSAALKAFVGEHGGACCTSSNADDVIRWALSGGERPPLNGETVAVLLAPDEHLGRNTATRLGLPTERDEASGRGPSRTVLYRRKLADGGLTAEQVRQAKMILWEGHCYVHTRFRAEDVDRLHAEYANLGGIRIIVHPECRREVVERADDVGSTEHIIRSIDQAEPGTNWAVGTEVHLVNRLAARNAARGVLVRMLGDAYCMCAQMSRIDSQHLLWVLDNLGRGRVINRVTVEPSLRRAAGLAVDRMLGLKASSVQQRRPERAAR